MENQNEKILKTASNSEDKIQIASQSKRVSESSDDEIRAVIRYIIVLIGLPQRNDPESDISKQVIMNFIKDYWQNYRIEEIKLAFEFAVNKTFEVDLRLFDSPLNVEYLSRIVTAYRTFKNIKTKPMNKEIPELPPIKSVGKDFYEGMIAHIEKYKNFGYLWAWDKIFEYMEEAKILNDTLEEKKTFANMVRDQIQKEILSANAGLNLEAWKTLKNSLNGNEFKVRCRKERVLFYLKAKYPAI